MTQQETISIVQSYYNMHISDIFNLFVSETHKRGEVLSKEFSIRYNGLSDSMYDDAELMEEYIRRFVKEDDTFELVNFDAKRIRSHDQFFEFELTLKRTTIPIYKNYQ